MSTSDGLTFSLTVAKPEEWDVGIEHKGGVYEDLAKAAAKRIVNGAPGRVLVLAKRPDGTLIMQERDWGPADNEGGESDPQ